MRDLIDRWKNDFKGYVNALNIPRDDYNGIMAYIDELPSAQPGCEDAVSRTAAVALVEEVESKRLRGEIDLTYAPMIKGIKALPSAQPGWTYIEEELPKTIINKHTHDFQEYNCLCDFGEYGFDVRTYKFGNGHFWNGGGIVDKYVTAWQPLPEIPDALKLQPWEGEKP